MLIVGYSYGSLVGAAACSEIPEAIGYACICPPLDYGWALYLMNSWSLWSQAGAGCGDKPKLCMVGDGDQFCSLESYQAFIDTLPEPKHSVIVPNCHHMSMARHIPRHLTEWIVAQFGVPDLPGFGKQGFGKGNPGLGMLPAGFGDWPSGHDVGGFSAQPAPATPPGG